MVATIHKLGLLTLLLSAGSLLPGATAPSMTECRVSVNGYEGPCPLGALPAFFDDFAYTSGHTSADVQGAHQGDIFGENVWMTEDGPETTRVWYRFNRDDLPVPGSISFSDGTMRMLVPAGTRASDFVRSLVIHTGARFTTGTYHYRVRLAPLWEGQQLRLSAWTMSHQMFFERQLPHVRERYTYWSEMDFENQNHFQGQRVAGRFVPDYMTTMSVGNHYGRLERHPGYALRLGQSGPVEPADGRGALAREGAARQPHTAAAPRVDSWSEQWLDLSIHLDGATKQTIYRMSPASPDFSLSTVASRPFVVGPDFFPRQPMHFAFSVHWVEPEGVLREDLWLEVDWIYHTPVTGLTADQVEAQVDHLRSRGHARVNTTGLPTFLDYNIPLQAHIEGPASVRCGEAATWRLAPSRPGPVHATLRIREIYAGGVTGRWREVVDYDVQARPNPRVERLEIEGTLHDRWRRQGRLIDDVTGWEYPHPENVTAEAARSVAVICD